MENGKSPEASQIDEFLSKYSPFITEIKKRLYFMIFVFIVAMISGFVFYERIIKFLIDILSLQGINIVFTSPFQFINLAVSCGIATGVVFVFPLLVYQILSFLRPALKVFEYKMLIAFLPFSIILFSIGFSFGVLIMRWQIQLFLAKSLSLGIGNVLDISSLLSTVLLVSSMLGLVFQFPIIMLLLLYIGIIKRDQLSKQRQWVYIGSLILVIFLPLDSILADLILALPIIALFELTLILNRVLFRSYETLALPQASMK